MPVPRLEQFAVIVDPGRDNVALAKVETPPGHYTVGGREIEVLEPLGPGERLALRDIPAGDFLVQYACPFAVSKGLRRGERADVDRVEPGIPRVDPATIDLPRLPPIAELPGDEHLPTEFAGYRRPDGRVGTRNFVLVVPTSMCSSHESRLIAEDAERRHWSRDRFPNVDGVRAIPHDKGCGCPDGGLVTRTMEVLAAYLDHPNVGAALVIELGCEKTNLTEFKRFMVKGVGEPQKPVVTIGVQQCGGTGGTVREGLKRVAELLPLADRTPRTRVPVSSLVLGTKCGGSDAFSGVSANPALGVAGDLLIARGGTSLITEVPELFGAEPILYAHARSPEVWDQIRAALAWYDRYTARFGASPVENPSPGNKRGGLVNIAIKSLGAVAKAGHSPIDGVVPYGHRPPRPGLYIMQGPGYDQYSTPGLVASGATIVAFTTGRGTTIGNAIAPVFKIASNTRVFEQMADDLDVNAGTILDGRETVAEVGRRIFVEMVRMASGEKPALAEEWRHVEFQIWADEAVAL
ncbi:MAG: UxaA family hydrolase [Acidobacteria bacterium]|nr:UxaA family hydrolase [Acidobacteriota bacterium]